MLLIGKAFHGAVALTWVLVLMLMVLVPSAAQWAWRLLRSVVTSPVRVVRGALASRLGLDCCTSCDPLDHIHAIGDPSLVAQTHIVAVDSGANGGSNRFNLRVDRLFRRECFGAPGFVPVILQHGVLQSGGIFLCNGPHSMAARLAGAGFDVWIANSRACFFATAADDARSERWDWTLDELGSEDVPAVVRYVAQQTGRRVVFAGHSQGGASGVVAFSSAPETMRRDVRLFVGLAPAVLLKRQEHWFFSKFLMPHPNIFERLGGHASFAAALFSIQRVTPTAIWSLLGVWAVTYLFHWRPIDLWRPEYVGSYFCFAPAKTSACLVTNWIEMLQLGRIRNRRTGKPYSLEPMAGCRVALFYGENDTLVQVGEPLTREMADAGCKIVCSHGIPGFDHMDVLWARTAPELVFEPLIAAIRQSADGIDPDCRNSPHSCAQQSPAASAAGWN